MNILWKASTQSVIALLLCVLPACTPIFGPLKTGRIYSSFTMHVADTEVKFNLHHYEGGGSALYVWCQHPQSDALPLFDQLKRYSNDNSRAAFTDKGWQLFTGFAMSDISKITAENIARGVFRVLESDVWLIEKQWGAAITFDRCRSTQDIDLSALKPSLVELVKPSPRGPNGTHWWKEPPFFTAHKRPSDGRFCLTINNRYLRDEATSWDICTADIAKTWALVQTQ